MVAAPPETKRTDHVDVLHGKNIPDPYRWLEDVDSAETKAWIAEQNKYARAHLDRIPGRDALRTRIAELMNFSRTTGVGILKRGGRLFFLRQDGGQNQPVLYVQDPGGQPRELLNPNTLTKDGTAAVSTWAPSGDGKYLTYGIAKAGSDWQEWFVRDVASGKDTGEKLEWVKFSTPEWSPDHAGFYYSTYPKPEEGAALVQENYYNKLYYHRLGTRQSEDKVIYERPDQKEWAFGGKVTEDGQRLVLNVEHGTRVENLIYVMDLRANGKVTEIVKEFTGSFSMVGSRGSVVYFHTTHKAPRGRIVAIDLNQPAESKWKEIVPESKDPLESVVWSANRLFCGYMSDVKSVVRMISLDGKHLGEVKLPGMGQVGWSPGKQDETEQFFVFTGYMNPPAIYRYNLNAGASTPFFTTKLAFDPSAYETKQVFYPSKDGTKIPMFLTYRKGLRANGQNPTLLYGYGGFSVAVRPAFSVYMLTWLEQGGVLAVANLRGGSEYGEDWHRAGMLDKKQNVFDDFIAAAEWLIANKYTNKTKIAIEGGSNGGLLVGAVLNQRPDLFGAAIPHVGVMDMLRFHKFTIGRAWTSDYGSPDKPREFETLLKYSPLQNAKRGTVYPPVMIMTADHDDRVVPSHSFKYAAQMQYAQEGKAPILIRIEPSAGHGAGKPASKLIEEYTDTILFLRDALKM
ncbi:MAG: S9 family peptidase [Acidobacteria bacterium]|nr:S9 family peptidase [Acidobacteriota bacterium]